MKKLMIAAMAAAMAFNAQALITRTIVQQGEIEPREFSIETGELTNTLKLRRAIINALYADQIEAMYAV